MDQPQPQLSTQRGLSLKLKVTFLAFLAVLPALIFLAILTASEGQTREQEREWQTMRMDVASSINSWVESRYVDAQRLEVEVPVKDVWGEMKTDLSQVATELGLNEIALFWWNGGPRDTPVLEFSARVGNLPTKPDKELEAAIISKLPTYSSPVDAETPGNFIYHVSFPIWVQGQLVGVARVVLDGHEWTKRALDVNAGLARWVEKMIRVRQLRIAGNPSTDKPLPLLPEFEALLSAEIESKRAQLGIKGLAIFWNHGTQEGPELGLPIARAGTTPRDWTQKDRESLIEGRMSDLVVRRGADPSQVSLPLRIRGHLTGVAHFEIPPPVQSQSSSRAFLFAMIGVMALVLGFLFFYMNQTISQPIQNLISAMSRGSEGELEPIAEGAGSGEVSWLAGTFNRMVQKLKSSAAENRQLMTQIQRFNEELKTKVKLATTEVERTNLKLLGLQRELSEHERLASLGQLAGNMAHELGTPLNAMSGHIELLLSDESATLAPDVAKRLRLIGGQIDRLSTIIQKTLHQLRAPAPQFVSVDLNSLAQGITTLIQPTVSSRQITLRSSLAPSLPRIAGDPEQLEQVLMNLVNNAVDAMPQGGSLDILTAFQDGQVCLQVRDSGLGIPKAEREQIFEPFFTTKRPGKGTGLGLAIVKSIVKSHQGTIEVQSDPGKGSWFTVRIPPEERPQAGIPTPAAIPAVRR